MGHDHLPRTAAGTLFCSFWPTTVRLPAKKVEKSPNPLAFSVDFVYKARAETLLFPRCHRAVSAVLCVFWIPAGE
jgi:hypothetical protein